MYHGYGGYRSIKHLEIENYLFVRDGRHDNGIMYMCIYVYVRMHVGQPTFVVEVIIYIILRTYTVNLIMIHDRRAPRNRDVICLPAIICMPARDKCSRINNTHAQSPANRQTAVARIPLLPQLKG